MENVPVKRGLQDLLARFAIPITKPRDKMTHRSNSAWWAAPLRVSVIYALAASLYIAVSDEIVGWAAVNHAQKIIGLQSLKGLGFVTLSSLLIFALVSQGERSLLRAQQELKRDEEAFKLFFRYAPIPLLVYDQETRRILEVNAAAEKLYGGPASEIQGWRIEDLHHPEDFDTLMDYLKTVTNEPATLSARHRRLNGEIFEALLSVQPITLHGRACRLVSAKDATAEQRLAEALASAEQASAEAEAARLALLARISHDMRTAIANVLGFLQLLESEPIPPRQQAFLAEAKSCAQDLHSQIEGLLRLSKIQSHLENSRVQRMAMPEFLSQCISEFQDDAKRKNVEFKTSVEQGTPLHMVGSMKGLRSILRLLLANALRYASGGQIQMSASFTNSENPALTVSILTSRKTIGVAKPGMKTTRIETGFPRIEQPLDVSPLGLPAVRRLCKIIGAEFQMRNSPAGSQVLTVKIPGRLGEDGAFRWG